MRIGIIGGSGIGEQLVSAMSSVGEVRRHEVETPFGAPSDAVLTGAWRSSSGETVDLALLSRHGDGHRYPPHRVPYRANIWAMKTLGVTHIIATCAVGSLCEDVRPGDVVLCDQVLDRTDGRTRTFFDDAAVHVEFADPVCGVMRQWLLDAGKGAETTVHAAGTYVTIEGPSFSTRAEAAMHRAMGAHVVGMTAMPEARLAREAQIGYAIVALPTDDDCWRPRAVADEASLLREIRSNLERASAAALTLIRKGLDDVTTLKATPSMAHRSLAYAVWSSDDALTDETRARLDVLRGN